ncbi:MAG: hypothetical protein HY051_02815 [Candidatus Aenigmarchaeota archaeon]|nr:hypothetical protein [Candidatus Aenigmarchaeota archaeon]
MPNPTLYWLVGLFLAGVLIVAVVAALKGIFSVAIASVSLGGTILLAYILIIPGVRNIALYVLTFLLAAITAWIVPQALSDLVTIATILPKTL